MSNVVQSAVVCPECDGQVDTAANTVIGEVVACSDCSAELEVVSLEPLSVELAPEVEEDWGE